MAGRGVDGKDIRPARSRAAGPTNVCRSNRGRTFGRARRPGERLSPEGQLATADSVQPAAAATLGKASEVRGAADRAMEPAAELFYRVGDKTGTFSNAVKLGASLLGPAMKRC